MPNNFDFPAAHFDFPAESFCVGVSFRLADKEHMSLLGLVNSYAKEFPIAESTKTKLTKALYQQVAAKINESYRFITGVLHQPVIEKSAFVMDVEFKSFYRSWCDFSVYDVQHNLNRGKHFVTVQVTDYMAIGGIEEFWKREALTKKKK